MDLVLSIDLDHSMMRDHHDRVIEIVEQVASLPSLKDRNKLDLQLRNSLINKLPIPGETTRS